MTDQQLSGQSEQDEVFVDGTVSQDEGFEGGELEGWVDEEARQRWRKDTMSCMFSVTKSASSGLLDYKEKIVKYWPEFGQNGKENITLETYISLKGGLSVVDEHYSMFDLLENPGRLGEALAKQASMWEPGTKHGYHAFTFALYLDQIVRRVDPKGRSLALYFKEEIAEPFDIEFYIGLPTRLFYRAPRAKMLKEVSKEEIYKDFKGDNSLLEKIFADSKGYTKTAEEMNKPYLRELPLGSAGGHGTAESMAKLHSILAEGGYYKGRQLLSKESIDRFMVPLSCGWDCIFGNDLMWSLGPMVFAAKEDNKMPTYSFGHYGYGGQLNLADPTNQIGLTYTTNYLHPVDYFRPGGDRRATDLCEALYECVFKLENRAFNRIPYYDYSSLKQYMDSIL